jgi:hypothetical protein
MREIKFFLSGYPLLEYERTRMLPRKRAKVLVQKAVAGARFPPSFDQTRAVVSRLPAEVTVRVARDNALAVYNLR